MKSIVYAWPAVAALCLIAIGVFVFSVTSEEEVAVDGGVTLDAETSFDRFPSADSIVDVPFESTDPGFAFGSLRAWTGVFRDGIHVALVVEIDPSDDFVVESTTAGPVAFDAPTGRCDVALRAPNGEIFTAWRQHPVVCRTISPGEYIEIALEFSDTGKLYPTRSSSIMLPEPRIAIRREIIVPQAAPGFDPEPEDR